MITLDLNHFGFLRAGRPERRRRGREEGKREDILDPGPTSMVVSWTAKIPRALTRVVIREGGFSRANLHGGELDEEPSVQDDGQ